MDENRDATLAVNSAGHGGIAPPLPPMPPANWNPRLDAVIRLTELFWLERMVHLTVTSISLIMLLGSTLFMILTSQAGPGILTLMFGSSGLITYSANRLLRMWDQAVRVATSTQGLGEE